MPLQPFVSVIISPTIDSDPPAFRYKGSSAYIGPTWIIQGDLLISWSLTTLVKSPLLHKIKDFKILGTGTYFQDHYSAYHNMTEIKLQRKLTHQNADFQSMTPETLQPLWEQKNVKSRISDEDFFSEAGLWVLPKGKERKYLHPHLLFFGKPLRHGIRPLGFDHSWTHVGGTPEPQASAAGLSSRPEGQWKSAFEKMQRTHQNRALSVSYGT